MKRETVFIVGHKNPDTDSICSAIAYADIKNRTEYKKFIPKRAGQLNEETRYVLNRFGVEPPEYVSDVGTQVKDMEIRQSPNAHKDLSIKNAWELMRDNSLVTLPIRDENGGLEGLLTIGDIAKTFMEKSDNRILSVAKTKYKAVAETISGKIVEGDEDGYVDGKVMIGASKRDVVGGMIEKGDLLIVGNREEDQYNAIELGASCVIACMVKEVSEKVTNLAREKNCTIIFSSLDTYKVANLINQSVPVEYIMIKDNIIAFNTEDYTDNIKDLMIKNRHRAFPVINKKGRCIGTISRRNFMGMRKKQIILVDHNEKDQAVDNIDSAEILEIVDHHRLGSLQTIQPVLFRNEPVGCTATIMYRFYMERNLEISPSIAGLLCAAILSDTLMFRSPTCTITDKMAAGALALIAEIDIEKFASEMFSAGSDLKNKLPEEIFYQDYKKFIADGSSFGVGQISSMNAEELNEVKEKLMPFIKTECERQSIGQIYFMLTNIMAESTELLYCGEGCEQVLTNAFHAEPVNGSCILKGVVSRKKQLIPALMEVSQDMIS